VQHRLTWSNCERVSWFGEKKKYLELLAKLVNVWLCLAQQCKDSSAAQHTELSLSLLSSWNWITMFMSVVLHQPAFYVIVECMHHSLFVCYALVH